MATPKKRPPALKRLPARKRARKAKAGTRGLPPAATRLDALTGEAAEARARVEHAGGQLIGAYHDPLGGNPLLLAVLPIDQVEPTPFQRDVSDMHHKRLADVLDKTGYFLDPIIVITAPGGAFWTPNGGHRLAAMRRLGARAISALVVPRREIAWQILALNTEKAHNLRDKSLEVIRIFRNLMEQDAGRAEKTAAYYLEEASLVTMGLCYERQARFSGAVYHSFVRRLTAFSGESLAKALKSHERHADLLLELDARVGEVVARLKARGFASPYLKSFVAGRINPLRFMKEPPALEDLITTMRDRAARFNVDKVKQEDIVAGGGAGDESD